MSNGARITGVESLGFTPRQARFLVLVLEHAGVCLPRQYRTFSGIAHGREMHRFFDELTARGFAATDLAAGQPMAGGPSAAGSGGGMMSASGAGARPPTAVLWRLAVTAWLLLAAGLAALGWRRHRCASRWALPAWLSLVALLGPAGVAAQTPPGTRVEYYHLDALGSVRVVTNEAGEVRSRHDYLPFGEEWQGPTPPVQRRLFTGKERDFETGLDYFGARYLRADFGRFTTVDPELNVKDALVDPQRWNRYAYARNNPLKYADPDGRDAIYVNYPSFPITLPGTHTQLPLGHAAVITVDEKTGATRYYEYGRYDGEFGNVRRKPVPDLVMGNDGKPTAESVEKLKQFVSKNLGRGTAAEFTYYDDADSKKVIGFAEQRMHDDRREAYSWSPLGMNTCKTFAADAVEAGRPQAPWWKRWLGLKREAEKQDQQ